MQGSMRLQEWIHRMEVGAGAKYVRWFGAVIGFVVLALIYNALCFRNFMNPEAMDMAQLGRNIARGEGFTTDYVRPLSVRLTHEARADKSTLLKEGHRDISNPPVYPLLLAGVLAITPDPGNLLEAKRFSMYLPNLYITILNQLLLGVGALLVFLLGKRWFDRSVGLLSALLFLFTELYWRFSVSGLSTMLLIDLLLCLALLLSRFEQRAREETVSPALMFGIGALVGLMLLTRYSAGWLIAPVLLFVGIAGGVKRWRWVAITFATFVVIAAPWLVRNTFASGLPFGTATYAPIEATAVFPGDTVPRALSEFISRVPGETWSVFVAVLHKGIGGIREAIGSELPRMGGSWIWAFFLVGLLMRFQSITLSRMRWFTVGTIAVLIPVQALCRTFLSVEVVEVNSENLLVLVSPLVLILGVGFFFVLLESLAIPSLAMRWGMCAGFVVIMALPMVLMLLPPRVPTNSAPYYPPRIQQVAHYLGKDELWMSDMPWAVAWYGDRQCLGLTLTAGKEFFQVTDFYKTVNGLYIGARTADAKFVSGWFGGTERGWAQLMLQTFAFRQVPRGFTLTHSPDGLATLGELVLTDRDRWSEQVIP